MGQGPLDPARRAVVRGQRDLLAAVEDRDPGVGILAAFVGYEVVSKVPTMLHTPLMSGANAVHGVIVVGAMLVAATAAGPVAIVLALLAVILGTINVVGGFVVTDRMLGMFKQKPGQAGSVSKGKADK